MGKDVEFKIPQPFELDVDLTSSSSMAINGNMNTRMTIDPLTINPVKIDMGLDNVKMDMGLDNVKVDMGLDKINVCMSFAIKEFPSMRVHFPMDFAFGIKMLGMEVLGFSVCGKAMILTEDNPRTMFYTPTRRPPEQRTRQENDTLKVKIQDE